MTTYLPSYGACLALWNPELLGGLSSCVAVGKDINVLLNIRPSFLGDPVHQPAVLIAPQRSYCMPATLCQINVHFFEKRMSIHDRFPMLRAAV